MVSVRPRLSSTLFLRSPSPLLRAGLPARAPSTDPRSLRRSIAQASTTFKLNTGAEIPATGLGTWQSAPGEVANAVSHALKHGYTHVDGAWIYGNENEVGQGIKDAGVSRESFFYTTKVWNTYHNDPEACLDASLKATGLDYADLLLIHWPLPLVAGKDNVPRNEDGSVARLPDWTIRDSWLAMEKLVKTGKVKAIGVSNWSIPYLKEILEVATIVPAVNQVELHPYNPQHELVAFCQEKGIVLEAYSPLGSTNSPLLTDSTIVKIAEKHKESVGTVLISYQVNRGIVVLPKSVTPSRIESNHKIITLDDEDMKTLNEMAVKEGKQKRFVKPNWGTDFGFEDWN